MKRACHRLRANVHALVEGDLDTVIGLSIKTVRKLLGQMENGAT